MPTTRTETTPSPDGLTFSGHVAVTPFTIAIPEAELEDLRDRLRRTRWPEAETVDDWSQGIPLAYVQELCRYWADSYDWRATETRLNGYPQFRTQLDGLGIHFLHVRSPEPDALPLVMTHGWPGSIIEFAKVIDPLTDPASHGGDPGDAFHLVLPSLPGYGFSDKPDRAGWTTERIAQAWAALMARLDYSRYGAQGGDWGASVTMLIGQQDVEHLAGIHLNMPVAVPTSLDDLTDQESAAIASFSDHGRWGTGYSKQQSTRPQTVGYGLVDSPAAQAAWIVEKFWAWTDNSGSPEDVLTRDELLDNVMMYWLTGAGASSGRLYWESFNSRNLEPVPAPTGCSIFPKEIFRPSRRWAEARFTDIRYWNELDKGGHFAAFEQPVTFVDEVRAFPAGPLSAELAARAAGWLARRGVGRDGYVVWQLPNSAEAVALYHASWRLGAVAAPVHPRTGGGEVSRVAGSLGAAIVVTEADVPEVFSAPPLTSVVDLSPEDIACVLWTAGSSGTPKGVLHRHGALAYKAPLMVQVHGLDADDAVLMPAPLAHISGLLNGILVPAAAGMRTVLMSRWDPDEAMGLIESERITFMVGPPTFFLDLLAARSFNAGRVASLRLISCGGAGVTEAVAAELATGLGCVVKRSYGSTEAPTVATAHAGDDISLGHRFDGRAVGAAELRVDDSGELLVRGPELFVGYTDPAATAAALRDGWFATGDRAVIDEDGWLSVLGRVDDLIIRGGENITPSIVESVLESHPSIRQAVVVGVPDARLGQRVAAVVVTGGSPFTVEDCRAWFQSRGVAPFMTPEVVAAVAAIPCLPAGKPDRAAVRALVAPSV